MEGQGDREEGFLDYRLTLEMNGVSFAHIYKFILQWVKQNRQNSRIEFKMIWR